MPWGGHCFFLRGRPGLRFVISGAVSAASSMIQSRPIFFALSVPLPIMANTRLRVMPSLAAASAVVSKAITRIIGIALGAI